MFAADACKQFGVLAPECNAGGDATLGQEVLAVLVPRQDALGGPAHGLKDGLLWHRIGQQSADPHCIKPRALGRVRDEIPDLGT